MGSSTIFLVSEAFELSVTGSKSISSEVDTTASFAMSHELTLEGFAAGAALLLLDIVQVGVAEKAHSTEEEGKVTLACVVEGVGLVPVWEFTNIVMGKRSLVTDLLVPGSFFLLNREVVVNTVCAHVRVRVGELMVRS